MTDQTESPLWGDVEPLSKRLVDTFENLEAAYTTPPNATDPTAAAPLSFSATASPDMTWTEAAAHLRLALAVRGRAKPAPLLPQALASETRLQALDAVARESDTGGQSGLWLLSDDARKRALEACPPALVADAVEAAPSDDKIANALHLILSPAAPNVDALSSAELRSLLAVAPAATHLGTHVASPETLRWQLRRKTRLEGYDAILKAGFVGRDAELAELVDFLTAGPAGAPITPCFVWGTGGVGKSTLLAAALREILGRTGPGAPVVAHLDFDRSDLDFKERLGLSIEVLSQAGLSDEQADIALQKTCDLLRDYRRRALNRNLASQESADQETSSLINGSLQWMQDQERPLVLVLDTFEQVDGSGETGRVSIRNWLYVLGEYTGVGRIRLVVAGRSDPKETGAASELMPNVTPRLMPISDLARAPAIAFLIAGGVPAVMAEALYDTLGGNPLVLRLVRELAAQHAGGEALGEIARDVEKGRVPRELVQGVLYDRFLKHIPDERARAYAHPGLVLPEITVELVRNVLAPLNGEARLGEKEAEQIFEHLAAASWLVQRDGDSLRQRSDVRRLMLRLMDADPDRAADVRRVRSAAKLYHAGRKEREHRAALAYHVLMDVTSRQDLQLLAGLNLTGCGEFLRRHRDDLPDVAQTFITALDFEHVDRRVRTRRRVVPDVEIPAERAQQHLPDDMWLAFMTGDGWGGGEGDRLVDKIDPAVALKLWTDRPVGPRGQPPTFVLQALAETGEWDTSHADLDAIVAELALRKRRLKTSSGLSRLYWATRLVLLSTPERFTDALPPFGESLLELLKAALQYPEERRVLTALPSLCGILEALSGGRHEIIPGEYVTPNRTTGSSGRIALQRAVHRQVDVRSEASWEEMITLQRDFVQRVSHWRSLLHPGAATTGAASRTRRKNETSPIDALLKQTEGAVVWLHEKPLAESIKLTEALRQRVQVRVDAKSIPGQRAGLVLLLRGQLSEVHRPAKQALVETFAGADYQALHAYATRVADHMTVLPSDLTPHTFARRALDDPAGCFHQLVQFADRAHVLESVLADATSFGRPSAKLARVLTTLGAWDRALTGGPSSDWWTDETQEERTARRRSVSLRSSSPEFQSETTMTGPTVGPGRAEAKAAPRAQMDPARLTAWLRKIEKRDPALHGELTRKLAQRIPPVPEGTVSPELPGGFTPPQTDRVLETIVREGRPALLVQNGQITPVDPASDELSREMITRLIAAAPQLQPVLPLVGRIDVSNFAGPIDYVGTGWLVDTDIVITNRHVADLIARQDGGRFTFRPGRFGDPLKVRVDYRRELANPAVDTVDVERVVWIEPDARKADIALLKVKPRAAGANGARPNAIPLADADAMPGTSVAVVGYPARAPAHIIPDQAWMDRIYGGEYNIKRVAPGLMDDPSRGWATHDCTTLGGNSGSVVVDMASGKAVALHFAGLYMIENYAVPASTIRRYLRERPWEGATRRGGSGLERKEQPPPPPAALPSPSIVTPSAAVLGSFSATWPVTLTVTFGAPVAAAPPPLTGAPAAPQPGDAKPAARALFDQQQGNGVLRVRPGFVVTGGRMTKERCLVVAAHPERLRSVRDRVPTTYAGFPVQVRPASIDEQLGDTVVVAEAVQSIQYDDDNRTGPGFSFNWVDEPMKLRLHVGPERSWSVLREFLAGARRSWFRPSTSFTLLMSLARSRQSSTKALE